MSSTLPTPVRRTERGAVSWVTLLLFVLVVGGGYLAWVWIPVYILDYEAKQVARDYINQAVKDPDDAGLVLRMTQKLAVLDSTEELDDAGKPVRVPVIVVDPSTVTWERDRDATPPTVHVAFAYRRRIELPFLDRSVEREFIVDITEDISRPDWGPAR
jgi:hypothetical protein